MSNKTYLWIEDRIGKASYKFWTTFMHELCPEVIVESKRNNRELVKAVKGLTDKENKGRQGLKNIGTFDGYYITNGKAIPITCEKESVTSKTVYKDLEGNEIKVNDGNTFVQICPIAAKVMIEAPVETPITENE